MGEGQSERVRGKKKGDFIPRLENVTNILLLRQTVNSFRFVGVELLQSNQSYNSFIYTRH